VHAAAVASATFSEIVDSLMLSVPGSSNETPPPST